MGGGGLGGGDARLPLGFGCVAAGGVQYQLQAVAPLLGVAGALLGRVLRGDGRLPPVLSVAGALLGVCRLAIGGSLLAGRLGDSLLHRLLEPALGVGAGGHRLLQDGQRAVQALDRLQHWWWVPVKAADRSASAACSLAARRSRLSCRQVLPSCSDQVRSGGSQYSRLRPAPLLTGTCRPHGG
ncbi:hypothetical protein [Actinomadura sp. 21ATH]|uniref:hypothetical protein n=1 Tax=Actinomadura sp. 21ATH TaxID=1735444 RepID=UPI0035BF11FD